MGFVHCPVAWEYKVRGVMALPCESCTRWYTPSKRFSGLRKWEKEPGFEPLIDTKISGSTLWICGDPVYCCWVVLQLLYQHKYFIIEIPVWWSPWIVAWYVARSQLMYGHIQIVLTSTQKVDNVIPTQERYVAFGYNLWVGAIKTTGNIRI